jgi:hypothetical protein
MGNLKKELLKQADGEPIEAVVIGFIDGYDWGDLRDQRHEISDEMRNRVLSWEEAAPLLDYGSDWGFGSVSCHAIVAWTATKVFFVVQYDGATDVDSVPRHPIDHEPEMPGGG